jgi:uncharacterized damage-inducible protein DinB
MVPRTVLIELYDYNYWARDRQLAACAALSEEQFLRPLGSSYSSLRDTLVHMVWGEWDWQERWRGRSPTLEIYERDWRPAQFPALDSVREHWTEVEQLVRNYLLELHDDRLRFPLSYKNLKGDTWTYPLWQTIFHLANHQTYHRGQVTTLLRQLGAKAESTDYLLRVDEGLKK